MNSRAWSLSKPCTLEAISLANSSLDFSTTLIASSILFLV